MTEGASGILHASRLKVLVCITGISGGGSEQSLAELIPGFIAAGIDVHVAYFVARSEDPVEQFGAHGAVVHHVEDRSLLGRARALRRIIRRERPDLVHTTLFDADIGGRLAAWGTGVPVLSSLVNDTYGQARQTDPNVPRGKLRLVQLVDGLTARHLTAHFHANSEAVRASAIAHLRIRPDAVSVVHRGRDPVRLGVPDPQRRQVDRARRGAGDHDLLIVTVGRQEFQKGHLDLIEAMAHVRRGVPDAHLVVAGREGAMTDSLREAIVRLGLTDAVELLGQWPDVPGLLQAADVFAFPSLYEGMPGAVVEAMALGVPIVASDIAPVQEVLGPDTGVLVPAGNPEALAEALVGLLQDRERASRLAGAARARFLEEFTLEHSVAAMTGLYRRTAGLDGQGTTMGTPGLRRQAVDPESAVDAPMPASHDDPVRTVIVTYRRPTEMARMLECLADQTLAAETIIVVDNDRERSAEGVMARAEDGVVYLAPGENLGPAGGLRVGIDRALQDDYVGWILCVDDDNPPPGASTVEQLWRFGRSARAVDPQVGGVGLAGALFDRSRSRIVRLPDVGLGGAQDVDHVPGNQYPLYRSEALRSIGSHDPRLFFGFEELELGLRLRDGGWRLLVDGDALLDLRRTYGTLGGGLSTGGGARRPDAPWRRYYSARNLVHISRGHSSPTGSARASLAPIVRGVLDVFRRQPQARALLAASIHGVADGWRGRMGRTVEPQVELPVPMASLDESPG